MIYTDNAAPFAIRIPSHGHPLDERGLVLTLRNTTDHRTVVPRLRTVRRDGFYILIGIEEAPGLTPGEWEYRATWGSAESTGLMMVAPVKDNPRLVAYEPKEEILQYER